MEYTKSSKSSRIRVDPSSWAARRKSAMERAMKIRSDRMRNDDDEIPKEKQDVDRDNQASASLGHEKDQDTVESCSQKDLLDINKEENSMNSEVSRRCLIQDSEAIVRRKLPNDTNDDNSNISRLKEMEATVTDNQAKKKDHDKFSSCRIKQEIKPQRKEIFQSNSEDQYDEYSQDEMCSDIESSTQAEQINLKFYQQHNKYPSKERNQHQLHRTNVSNDNISLPPVVQNKRSTSRQIFPVYDQTSDTPQVFDEEGKNNISQDTAHFDFSRLTEISNNDLKICMTDVKSRYRKSRRRKLLELRTSSSSHKLMQHRELKSKNIAQGHVHHETYLEEPAGIHYKDGEYHGNDVKEEDVTTPREISIHSEFYPSKKTSETGNVYSYEQQEQSSVSDLSAIPVSDKIRSFVDEDSVERESDYKRRENIQFQTSVSDEQESAIRSHNKSDFKNAVDDLEQQFKLKSIDSIDGSSHVTETKKCLNRNMVTTDLESKSTISIDTSSQYLQDYRLSGGLHPIHQRLLGRGRGRGKSRNRKIKMETTLGRNYDSCLNSETVDDHSSQHQIHEKLIEPITIASNKIKHGSDEESVNDKRPLQDPEVSIQQIKKNWTFDNSFLEANNEASKLFLLKERMKFRLQKRKSKGEILTSPLLEYPWVQVVQVLGDKNDNYVCPEDRNKQTSKEIKKCDKYKQKSVNKDNRFSDDHEKWSSKGKHGIKQKNIAQENASMRSKDKQDTEKFLRNNQGISDVREGVKDGQSESQTNDDRMTEGVLSTSPCKPKPSEIKGNDDECIDIEMKHCTTCNKSFAPPTFQKICKSLDKSGNPKCLKMYSSKRKVFSSARARIANNKHLDSADQRVALDGRKKVVAELKAIKKGKMPIRKKTKWQEQSSSFREAMRSTRE